MAKCNWEPFFTEFTDKMLEYKDIEKRPELLKKIGTAFSQAKYEAPKCGSSNNGKELTLDDDIQNLDPFSILMFIVRGGEKIKNICVQIEQVFQMENHFPLNNYDSKGIPIPKSRSKRFCLTWYFETPRDDNNATIEYLWDLFEAAANLRNDYSDITKKKFIDLYTKFEQYVPDYWKISSVTDLLFLIAPSRLIGLNSKCLSYINFCFPSLRNDAEVAHASFKNGEFYLGVCESLKANLEKSDDTLLDFYYDSYFFYDKLETATREFLFSKGYKKELENPNNAYNYSKIGDSNHKGEFWMWPNDTLMEVHTTWYMALNDWINGYIYFVTIPPETFKEDQIYIRDNGKPDTIFKLDGDKFVDRQGKKHLSHPIEITSDLYIKYQAHLNLDKKYTDLPISKNIVRVEPSSTSKNIKTTLKLLVAADSEEINEDVKNKFDSSQSKKPGIHTSKGSEKKEEIGKSGEEVVMNYLKSAHEFLGKKIVGEINCYAFGEDRDDNKGYDISFIIEGGEMIYVDVKSSSRSQTDSVEFFLSSHEYVTMINKEKEREGSYYICFVDNLDNKETQDMEIRAVKASDIVSNKIPITYRINIEELKTI